MAVGVKKKLKIKLKKTKNRVTLEKSNASHLNPYFGNQFSILPFYTLFGTADPPHPENQMIP